MEILVTGAAGFVGSHLAERLAGLHAPGDRRGNDRRLNRRRVLVTLLGKCTQDFGGQAEFLEARQLRNG